MGIILGPLLIVSIILIIISFKFIVKGMAYNKPISILFGILGGLFLTIVVNFLFFGINVSIYAFEPIILASVVALGLIFLALFISFTKNDPIKKINIIFFFSIIFFLIFSFFTIDFVLRILNINTFY